MLERLDWKFVLSLIFAIAGVVVPVLLWQIDSSSKAMTLTVRSIAELQPRGISEFDGVQLLLDGKPQDSPFVSVLELSNSGSKPIVASDFEGALVIQVAKPVAIVKARNTSSTPATLTPVFTNIDGELRMQPLLLNPGDVFRIALVTVNGRPAFSAHARIAGVTEVAINDRSAESSRKLHWVGRVVVVFLLAMYMTSYFEFVSGAFFNRRFLHWPLARGTVMVVSATTILAMQKPGEESQITTLLPFVVLASFLAAPNIYKQFRRINRSSPPGGRATSGGH